MIWEHSAALGASLDGRHAPVLQRAFDGVILPPSQNWEDFKSLTRCFQRVWEEREAREGFHGSHMRVHVCVCACACARTCETYTQIILPSSQNIEIIKVTSAPQPFLVGRISLESSHVPPYPPKQWFSLGTIEAGGGVEKSATVGTPDRLGSQSRIF